MAGSLGPYTRCCSDPQKCLIENALDQCKVCKVDGKIAWVDDGFPASKQQENERVLVATSKR